MISGLNMVNAWAVPCRMSSTATVVLSLLLFLLFILRQFLLRQGLAGSHQRGSQKAAPSGEPCLLSRLLILLQPLTLCTFLPSQQIRLFAPVERSRRLLFGCIPLTTECYRITRDVNNLFRRNSGIARHVAGIPRASSFFSYVWFEWLIPFLRPDMSMVFPTRCRPR